MTLAPVRVHVHQWDVRELRDDAADLTVTCGTGTYVRALARDLGRFAGSGAHLTALRRTRIGAFDVTRAHPLAAFAPSGRPYPPLRTLRVVADD